MCSTPPAITTSYWPKPMPDAVVVTDVMAPAHMRSMAKPGDGLGKPGQDRGGAADGETLIARLCGRGNGDLVDARGVELRITAKQLADGLDDEVVRAGLRVDALGAGLAERSADAVDEHDVALSCGGWSHANSS